MATPGGEERRVAVASRCTARLGRAGGREATASPGSRHRTGRIQPSRAPHGRDDRHDEEDDFDGRHAGDDRVPGPSTAFKAASGVWSLTTVRRARGSGRAAGLPAQSGSQLGCIAPSSRWRTARCVTVLVLAGALAGGCGGNQVKPRAASTTKPREAPVIVGRPAGRHRWRPQPLPELRRVRQPDRRPRGRVRRQHEQLERGAAAARSHHADLRIHRLGPRQQPHRPRRARRRRRGRGPRAAARTTRTSPHRTCSSATPTAGCSRASSRTRIPTRDRRCGARRLDGRNQDGALPPARRAAPPGCGTCCPADGARGPGMAALLAGEAMAGGGSASGRHAGGGRHLRASRCRGLRDCHHASGGSLRRDPGRGCRTSSPRSPSDHLHVVATRSDHFVQSFAGGQPPSSSAPCVRWSQPHARTGTCPPASVSFAARAFAA